MRSTRTGEHNRAGGSNRAIRRCGDYIIGIEYNDAWGEGGSAFDRGSYRCRIFLDGALVSTQIVGEPGRLTRGVDDPVSYDETARTAVAFGVADKQLDEGRLDYNDAGLRIERWRGGRTR